MLHSLLYSTLLKYSLLHSSLFYTPLYSIQIFFTLFYLSPLHSPPPSSHRPRSSAHPSAQMPSRFDLIVVGGGPGGYVADIKAAQLGLSTACIEKGPTLGGTCLNIGCIPSKSLLHNSHLFHSTAHLSMRGIILQQPPSLELAQMQLHKTEAVAGLTRGIDMLFAQNKITRITGSARLESPTTLSCTGGQVFEGKNIILATGSHAFCPSVFPKPDEERIVTSMGALSFSTVPKHLVVIGTGVIGLE